MGLFVVGITPHAVDKGLLSKQRIIEAGDHHFLVGEVLDFSSREGYGLGYASGGYFSLALEREAAKISTQEKHVSVGVKPSHGRCVVFHGRCATTHLNIFLTTDLLW